MSIYKQASRLNLMFIITAVGSVSTNQLWQVRINDLINYEEELQEEVDKLGKSTRRGRKVKTKEAELLELRLAIVSDVLNTREAEAEAAKDAASIKEHNQKILALIQEKKEGVLKDLSIEELEKQLK